MRKACGFVKGILTGVAVGAIMGIMFDPMTDRERRKLKRTGARYMHSCTDMMDSLMRR